MQKIRKNDLVEVVKGKDKGKRGKVLKVFVSGRALVEGINLVKKHKRQTRQDQQAGIVSLEAPLAIANIMYFCKQCNRPRRIGFSIAKDSTKTRICRGCKQGI